MFLILLNNINYFKQIKAEKNEEIIIENKLSKANPSLNKR